MDGHAHMFASRILGILAVVLIVCGTFAVLVSFNRTYILGADESVYATKARSWIETAPADQFEIYRPIAMPVIGWAILQFDSSESALRLFGVVTGALAAGALFALIALVTNIPLAVATTALVVSSYLFLRQSPLFLNDVASSGLLFACLVLVYRHYLSRGTTVSIYAVAPLAALAFYLRYGAITPLAVIAIMTVLLLLARFLRTSSEFIHVQRTLVVGIALLLPHLAYSFITTKSFFGIIDAADRAAHRTYMGEGLIQYIRWLPGEIGGLPLGICALVGTMVVIVLLAVPHWRDRYIGIVWLGCIGLATFILTGLFTHAEPRYVFFPMALLAGVGVAGTYYGAARLHMGAGYLVLCIVFAASLYFGVGHYQRAYALFENERTSANNAAYRATLQAIADRTSGACSIWTALNRPRASWYTKCHLFRPEDRIQTADDMAAYDADSHYVIVGERLRENQITPAVAAMYGVTLTELMRTPTPAYGDVVLYEMVRASQTPATSTPI
jgi:hypothetical protein